MTDLNECRKQIDDIDEQILNLLNNRAEIVMEIAEVKKRDNVSFYIPEREKAIVDRLKSLNKGRFPNETLEVVFKEIFCASLTLEQPSAIKIAHLGPQATFTHQAALKQFSAACVFLPVASIKKVFETVEAGEADYGVVPIENSNEGIVNYTLDMFIDFGLNIFSEILLTVKHNLLSKTSERVSIKKIYSHPHATAQCRLWLESNMLGVPIFDSPSTAEAASLASLEEGAAAIASDVAAKIYNLNFIEKQIEDNKNNITRFLVISGKSHPKTGNDKTSIMFTLKDEPSALHSILSPFKKFRINLTKIESRPSKKKVWDYIFFVDLEGHIEDKKVNKALNDVKKHCLYMKVLGSYPQSAI